MRRIFVLTAVVSLLFSSCEKTEGELKVKDEVVVDEEQDQEEEETDNKEEVIEETEETEVEDETVEEIVAKYLPSPGVDKKWVLQENVSNEFDEGLTSDAFVNDWQNKFFNGWKGPGDTRYTPESATIVDGELIFTAKIVGSTIQTGCISTKEKVGYPMYMEARVKISKSVLSTAVWMLSDDSTEEIDNLEAYGYEGHDWYAKRLHLSHHVFIREPFQDYQPTSDATWYADAHNTIWSDDYHDYGVLWMSPTELSYYVDGVLVRTVPASEIDPNNYTNGNGLTKPMYVILSQAAQPWREGTTFDDFFEEVSVTNTDMTKTYFDWVRVYQPE